MATVVATVLATVLATVVATVVANVVATVLATVLANVLANVVVSHTVARGMGSGLCMATSITPRPPSPNGWRGQRTGERGHRRPTRHPAPLRIWAPVVIGFYLDEAGPADDDLRPGAGRRQETSMGDMMGQYTKRSFSAPIRGGATVEHAVYERGDGPPVVLIQELPGIGKETLRLADRFMAKGFRVVMPHLFGPLGRTSLVGNTVRVLCMRREFAIFNSGDSSPVIDWLRALCNDVRDAAGVRGVGVIGMCLTGNFAISLMADASVLAAVASQPSLPVFKKNELHMGEASIAAARGRLDQEGPMLAYRFKGDPMCSGAKFKAIAKHFNDDAAERVKLVTLPGRGHSVLTLDFVDEAGHPTTQALDEVLAYFTRKLMPA